MPAQIPAQKSERVSSFVPELSLVAVTNDGSVLRWMPDDSGAVWLAQRMSAPLRVLHDDLRGTSGRLVNIVHDEIIIECDASDTEEMARLLEGSMETAGREFLKNVPVKVESKISEDWCK